MDTIKINNPDSFTTYPNNSLCAIIEKNDNAGNTLDALIAAGIPKEDIDIYYGKKGVEVIDSDATHHGLLASIAKVFRGYGDEENKSLHIYEAAVENGYYVFTVKAKDNDAEKEKVRKILANHSARDINYFGSWVVEALETK
jgi:hypothetical protein